jgi:hypothetical protein
MKDDSDVKGHEIGDNDLIHRSRYRGPKRWKGLREWDLDGISV